MCARFENLLASFEKCDFEISLFETRGHKNDKILQLCDGSRDIIKTGLKRSSSPIPSLFKIWQIFREHEKNNRAELRKSGNSVGKGNF